MSRKPEPPPPFSWQRRFDAATVHSQAALENAILDLLRRHRDVPVAALAALFAADRLSVGVSLDAAYRNLARDRLIVVKRLSCAGVTIPVLRVPLFEKEPVS